MSTKYSIVIKDDGQSVATLYAQGETTTVDETHPNFSRIVSALANGEDPSRFLSIAQAISDMDERVVVQGSTVWFDGEPVDNALTRTILRYQSEGRTTDNLIKFLERLAENPSKRGREVIFEWVAERDLTIDEEGRFIGWKGVRADGGSVNSGTAFVNDEEFTGSIPNPVGAVVSMPRSEVMDDPNQDCHIGLHVGTYEYAKGFGAKLLEVAVDPADVVSVPASATSWKIRCCRYEVLAEHVTESASFEGDYEPDAEFEDDPGVEALKDAVPDSFLGRLKARLSKKD